MSLIFIVAVFSSVTALGNQVADSHTHDAHGKCSALLSDKNYQLIFSGRDEDVQADLEKYADMLFGNNGVLEKLGMSRPPQIIQFLAGRDVNAIASNGRLPVGHWHDGANILNSNNRPGLIYEIVINGGNLRHSIYRDDVPLKRQFSILNHVAGHTHFGANTMWSQNSNVELNQAAYDFDSLMEDFKRLHGSEEVSEWYQYLLSLTYAQDLVLGDYAKPSDFKAGEMKHPTANILQVMVANLPTSLAPWKIQMAERFEQINRYIPGAIRTKIINEGFATLMQELLPPHTGMNTFDHAMEYCCFVAGVIRPALSNPYWLGLEAWRNIRKHFNEKPEIHNLSSIEKDRAFIAYASKEIIGKMDDVEFLRLGLDDSWVVKQNIALTRIAKSDEQDPDLEPDPNDDPSKPKAQHIIVTRDAQRVREGIIRQVFFSRKYQIPRPVLTTVSGEKIQLELSDEVGKSIPLTNKSIVETLYVMSHIVQKSVSLESTFKFIKPIEGTRKNTTETMSIRLRTTVSPSGVVQAEVVKRNGSVKSEDLKTDTWQTAISKNTVTEYYEAPKLAEDLKAILDVFIQDLDLANTDIKSLLPNNALEAFESTVTNLAEGVSPQLLLSIPTVPHAIDAYTKAVNSRTMKALQLAIVGKRKVEHNFTGVRIKVLPDIPYFEFDKTWVGEAQKDFPTPNSDNFKREALSLMLSSEPLSAAETKRPTSDRALDVQPINGEPGRRVWGPANPSGGNGSGNGEGEPGDGEPGDQPANGNQPGKGGGDPAYAEVDLETYAQALAANVSLPNLRPKSGQGDMTEEVRGDWAKSRRGPPISTMIARKAFEKGLAYYRQNPDSDVDVNKKGRTAQDISKIYKKGFSLLDPAKDWYVETFTNEPAPQANAQVTLIMDLSGSYNDHKQKTKQMFYDLRALLLKKYKNVTFRFVAFDGNAFDFEDPDEFFKLNLGGGTSYAVGLQKALDVQENFPESQYDRYVVLAGDMEDLNASNIEELVDQLRLNSQFFASVKMNRNPVPGKSDIETTLRNLAESDDYVSFVDLSPTNIYEPIVLRKLFKNED